MVAARAASEEAKARAAEEAEDRALREPVAPSARSRWQFHVEYQEGSEGETLVLCCYPRKVAFIEDDNPFALEPRGWLIGGGAIAPVSLVCWWIDDIIAGLLLVALLGLALLLAHRTRILRIHITRLNQFLVYERNPRRPIGIGPLGDLQMDVHAGTASMRCSWAHSKGPPRWFQLESLPAADWLTVQRFIKKHGLRGL